MEQIGGGVCGCIPEGLYEELKRRVSVTVQFRGEEVVRQVGLPWAYIPINVPHDKDALAQGGVKLFIDAHPVENGGYKIFLRLVNLAWIPHKRKKRGRKGWKGYTDYAFTPLNGHAVVKEWFSPTLPSCGDFCKALEELLLQMSYREFRAWVNRKLPFRRGEILGTKIAHSLVRCKKLLTNSAASFLFFIH